MPFKFGNSNGSKIYKGNTEITKVYKGSTVVYQLDPVLASNILYELGNENSTITGGWVEGASRGIGTFTKNSDNLEATTTRGSGGTTYTQRFWATNNKIDLTNYTTIKVEWEHQETGSNTGFTRPKMYISNDPNTQYQNSIENLVSVGGSFSLTTDVGDISSYTGNYHVHVGTQTRSTTTTMTSLLNTYKVYLSTDVFEEAVYAGTDSDLRKLDTDGNLIWVYNAGGKVRGVTTDRSGNIYISTDSSDTVQKLDANGSSIWSYTSWGSQVNDVAVDDNGFVYAGSTDNSLRKFDSDGNQIERENYSGSVLRVKTDNQGFLYTGNVAQPGLRKIDVNNLSNQAWTYFESGANDWIRTVHVNGSGEVYSGSRYSDTRKFTSSGSLIWSIGLVDGINDINQDLNGNIFLGIPNDNVQKRSGTDGSLIATLNLSKVQKIEIDKNGFVYIATSDNGLYKYSNDLNTQIWHYNDVTQFLGLGLQTNRYMLYE